MKIKKTAILGLGAVGTGVAARLSDYDPYSVVIIAEGERKKRYKEKGIYLNDKRYDFHYISPDEGSPVDFILVSVKYNHFHEAIKGLEKFIGESTVIMSLMNGISTEGTLGDLYGHQHMVYAYTVGISTIRLKNRVQIFNPGNVHYNVKENNSSDPRTVALKELFDTAGIGYVVEENILHSYWWKWMVNVGGNQVSVLNDMTFGELSDNPHAHTMQTLAMKEVIALSQATGICLDEKNSLDRFYTVLAQLNGQGKTSMLQDVHAKRPTEVDLFAGTVSRLGREYGVVTPVNDFIYAQIKIIEENY
jgi:2-dehydropantoate 2-reductase